MTEEQKQAMIEEGNRILKHGYGTKKSDELIKIALDALTAPEDWKQRAEAAEAALERESDIHIDTAASMREWRLRAEAAEAKLAELGASVPVYQYESAIYNEKNGDTDWYWDDCDKGFYDQYDPSRRRILFTRPAPAADLAEMVPDEMPTSHIYHGGNGAFNAGKESGWNACRAAMLRNIEEAQ
jgi:hypothetical protein